MFKKTMKFDDLDGNEVTQTFYFNYKKKEVAELLEFGAVQQFAEPGKKYMPLEEMMEKLTTPREEQGLSQQENNQQAYNIFQALILDAFGKKGEDNVTFEKSWELRRYFESHVAFDDMIFEFLGNEKLAAEFVESCLPPRLVAKAKEEMAKEGAKPTVAEMVQEADRRQQDPETRVLPSSEEAVAEKSMEELTAAEVSEMDDIAFKKLDPRRLSKEAMMAAFERKSKA